MIKTITKLEFKDSAIEKVKIAALEFSYTNKEGIIKHKDRIYIPFNVAKKSSLKGLKLCVHKSSRSKYFAVLFWFKGKPLILNLGKYITDKFGTKQCEDKLHQIVKDHTDDKGRWIKNPLLTEKNKTRVITDTQFTESKKKTINELIVACLKANLPKGKRAGSLRARSARLQFGP